MSEASGWQRLTTWMPGLRLFTAYDRAHLAGDLASGLVVALVVIPSAIAYADLAHCPPIAGLYAALGGMIAFALFTSSRHVIAGPDAAIAILVGAAVGPLSGGDPGQVVVLSTWLALLAACILLLAGWLKLGGVAEFLSSPVMLGFMNGAAVVIIGSQIGKLCGIGLHEENTLLRLLEWGGRLRETHGPTLAFGLGAVAVLAGLRRWYPRVPGTIVVFTLALVAGRCVDFGSLHVSVIGAVDTRIPSPVPPELALAEVGQLLIGALGLALLIFPEGILLGRAMASRHQYEIQADQELLALGMANLAAGFFRSFAVGGSQSRTLLNSTTGGQTQMVSLFAAGLLVGFMYFLAAWIATLPNVAIAAILIFTGLTLIEVRELRTLRRQDKQSGLIAWLTTLGVIAFGVLPGILVGIMLSLLLLLKQIARPQDALLGRVPGAPGLHDVGDDEAARTIPGLVVYRFYGPLLFANVRFFIERVEHFIAQEAQPVRQVILDARAVPTIDVTAAEQLRTFIGRLRDRGMRFVVAKAHLPLREAAHRLGLNESFPKETHYAKLADAVAAFEAAEASKD
ncbi:MAG: SulP family inorganic anion transporter [Planctomycetia bacterium]|nr:SulP family inorganic anion transporter [Planctomycetia bacterium]